MQDDIDLDELALKRTVLAAERTFSAWIRTGLAGVGGGLAVARLLIFENSAHQIMARVIGALLIMWGQVSLFTRSVIIGARVPG